MADITLSTSRFGDIQIDESLILHFLEPILGFENLKRFVILDHAEESPFKWLQSADEQELAFVVTNPKLFGLEYEFMLPEDKAAKLELTDANDALVLTIVNIPQGNPGEMTANLLGPIILNRKTKQALQIVLNDTEFTTKTRLIPDNVLSTEPSAGEPLASPATSDKGA